jgi:hypothetical protein
MNNTKVNKPQYFGINEVHTYQLMDNIFFVGMNVQSSTKDDTDEFMLMFSPDQIIDMYENLLKTIHQ